MRLPIEFEWRVTLDNLETGERRVFLMPKGKLTPVEVPEEQLAMFAEFIPEPPGTGRVPVDDTDVHVFHSAQSFGVTKQGSTAMEPEEDELPSLASDEEDLAPGTVSNPIGREG